MEIFGLIGEAVKWLLIIWVSVTGWYFAVSNAQRLMREGVEFSLMVRIPLYIYGYTGLIWNLLWNWTWGTIIFREIPRELFFTDRVQRLVSSDDYRKRTVAVKWAERLNKVDPGHVDLPER